MLSFLDTDLVFVSLCCKKGVCFRNIKINIYLALLLLFFQTTVLTFSAFTFALKSSNREGL